MDDLDSKDRLALQRSYVLNKVGLEAEPGDIRNAFRFAGTSAIVNKTLSLSVSYQLVEPPLLAIAHTDLEAIITDEDLTCKPPKPLEYAPCAQSHHTQ